MDCSLDARSSSTIRRSSRLCLRWSTVSINRNKEEQERLSTHSPSSSNFYNTSWLSNQSALSVSSKTLATSSSRRSHCIASDISLVNTPIAGDVYIRLQWREKMLQCIRLPSYNGWNVMFLANSIKWILLTAQSFLFLIYSLLTEILTITLFCVKSNTTHVISDTFVFVDLISNWI